MTRIIFQWMLIFIIGGILLLVSGESTETSTSEENIPNSTPQLILSTAENSSLEIHSNSVAPKTESAYEEPENLLSTISNIELHEASKKSKPIDGNKINNSVYSEVLVTENLTTLFPTDLSNEGSKLTNPASSSEIYRGGFDGQEISSTSKDNLGSEKELSPEIDVQDAEDSSEKQLISSSSEIYETSKIILNSEQEILSKTKSLPTKSSDQNVSQQAADSNLPSSIEKFDPTDAILVETSTTVANSEIQATKVGNSEDHSEKQSSTDTNSAHSSDKRSEVTTLTVSESTRYLETQTWKNTEKTIDEDSLSLLKTTPKSATKKRSLNNSRDIIEHHETTSASDSFSATSIQPELITLLINDGSYTSESNDESKSAKSNNSEAITMKENGMQNTNKNSAETLSTMPVPSIISELGTIENAEQEERVDIPLSNSENSSKNYDEKAIETESVNPELYTKPSLFIPNVSNDYSHSNDLNKMDSNFAGVTFDPDGMKNNEPQDPDSVVFYVPSNFHKVSTPENEFPSTGYMGHGSSEDEGEFEFVTHKSLEEGGSHENRTKESERIEFIPQNKEMNNSPQVSHHPMDMSEIMNFEANNSNSSSSLHLWDPSNAGWILPGSTTDTQIKRMDESENNESEEMLQDAPHFTDDEHTNNSPSSNLKIESKEKEELKTTSEADISSLNKDLEIETVTELGFVGFSNSFVPHQTDQSAIRPVKIQLTSPDDKSVSTSILPESFSTLAPEKSNGLKLVKASTGTLAEKVETSSTNTSSPIMLPNPAPNLVTEIVKNPELSTIAIQPELVPVSLDKNIPEATETSNNTSVADSTIAGIAVRTSVSVSLPLSKTKNDSQALQPIIEELLKKMNSSLLMNGSSLSILPDNSVSSVSTPSDSSTDGLTVTSDPTTTAGGFKIRKPKIKFPGGTDSATQRSNRPFTPSLKKPATTAGPPVSIFKKQRTRIASITSSTTARPFRPFTGFSGNLATLRIQYASDIPPGLLPQEFLISTEPVTTTTTEPTTTEEPISEVPFTDQTHVPTVVSEDDVTLIKVAGYLVIDRGLRWNDLLHNRHSPEYKRNAEVMHLYLERMFRSSPIASRLWKIQIDGFSGNKKTRPVGVDFFLYLIKTGENMPTNHLATVFHEKLSVNNTFGTFRVDTSKTAFEMIQEEPLRAPTPSPEEENVEPPIPQWAIAVIVIGAASLIFIVLFAAVTIYGRHHMRRRYSSKLSEEDMERSSGEWESKMAAAYENMAADTIYDAEDLHSDSYKKNSRIATFHGIPSTLKRCDSWSSNGWTTPPSRKRPHVH